MTDKPNRDTLPPPDPDYAPWTEDDIESFGTVTPGRIGDAKADARDYPELDELLRQTPDDLPDEPA